MKSNIFLSICLCAVASLSLMSCVSKSAVTQSSVQKTNEAVRLPVAIVKVKNVSRQIVIPGIVSALPDHSVKISPAVAGKLVEVYVIPGQSVKHGQAIAKLDDRHIRDQLDQAKAAIEAAQASVAQSQNNLSFAKDNFERQQKLFGAEVSAKKDVITAENQLSIAQSQLSAARSQLKSAEANYNLINTELEFTQVHSPIDGVVANRYLNAGDSADLNTPIVQVVNLATVIINATLPADTPEKVKVGQHTKITSEADPGTAFSGTVISVSPVVDTQSNSIRIQIRCLNSDAQFREGQAVAVSINSGSDKAALSLPETAVVPDPEKPGLSMVYVIKDGKAKRVPVTTGVVENKQVEIIKGLSNGDIVITEGAYGLPEDAEVTPQQ